MAPIRLLLFCSLALVAGCALTGRDWLDYVILPEQRAITVPAPEQLPPVPVPPIPPPRTVTDPQPNTAEWQLSLDEAIRIALVNARVIRVLTGVSATNSGHTIYDAAISNPVIDQQQARFDPTVNVTERVNRFETPGAFLDPLRPGRSRLFGSVSNDWRSEVGVSKTNVLGGQLSLNWVEDPTWFESDIPRTFPLYPENRSHVELGYTQPLLQGAGFAVNFAPVVIARIDTERSYFQYKDSVQELVRGVIEAYWNLIQARINLWARQNQLEVAEEAYRREEARQKVRIANLSDVAQARTTYHQLRAQVIGAKNDVLTREGALRNILGLPPSDCRQIIPVSSPTSRRLRPDWCELLRLAEVRRPDVVELKLVLEADRVRLLQAENAALPRLDATALYRWNGLSGEMPNGDRLASGFGQFTDWSVGVNFSVPLGLREGRARVRQQALLIARDRANLEQSLHAAAHDLAISVRDLDNAYEQYEAFKEVRAAALDNLRVQLAQFRFGRAIYLNVLQAIQDWGNAVLAESQSLTNYNILLATLERQTGTILETHGLVFNEERQRFAGPLGCCAEEVCYPAALPPTGEPRRYPGTGQPGENAFELSKPDPRKDTPTLPEPQKGP
jgi:outer membrane protein TolC